MPSREEVPGMADQRKTEYTQSSAPGGIALGGWDRVGGRAVSKLLSNDTSEHPFQTAQTKSKLLSYFHICYFLTHRNNGSKPSKRPERH